MSAAPSARIRPGRGAAAVLLALSVIGCQGKGEVSGKVVYQDKALASGTVLIVASDGSLHQGTIKTDGSYRIRDVPSGEARLAVNSPDPDRQLVRKAEPPGAGVRDAAGTGGASDPSGPLASRRRRNRRPATTRRTRTASEAQRRRRDEGCTAREEPARGGSGAQAPVRGACGRGGCVDVRRRGRSGSRWGEAREAEAGPPAPPPGG